MKRLETSKMPKHSRRSNKGFSLIELLIVVAVILVIAGIAIPNLIRSRMSANEASAVGSLRTLNTTLMLYSTNCNIGFSANLTALGPAVTAGTPDCTTGEDLVDAVMSGESTTVPVGTPTTFTKSGYLFTYAPSAAPAATYTITAVPTAPNGTGIRTFYTDQTGVIHANAVGANPPLATDPPL